MKPPPAESGLRTPAGGRGREEERDAEIRTEKLGSANHPLQNQLEERCSWSKQGASFFQVNFEGS